MHNIYNVNICRYGGMTLHYCKKPVSLKNEIRCLEAWRKLAK